MPRDGTKNLKPMNRRTEEEQRKIAQKGGVASGIARREKKTAREVAQLVLAGNIPNAKTKDLVKKIGLPETELNMQAAIIAGQARAATYGNTSAAEFVLNLGGEQLSGTAEELPTRYTELPARVLGRQWVDVYRSIFNKEYTQYDFKGGRGSLKSSACGLFTIDDIMRYPNHCGLAVRQLKDNLADSVYAQIVWAIDELGLSDQFKCTKSPLQIKRIETGQVIYFRGGDDPGKIKSIKPPNGMHIGIVWIEEADQIHGADALRNITQSAFRGGDDGILFRSYNTPIGAKHFINVEERQDLSYRLLHHSHFKEAPRKWLGTKFWEDAAALKELNERAYRHEYDGEATGTGATVFENVVTREITDHDISYFDRLYRGLDWGWSPDPTAYVKCYYDAAQRRLFIFDEFSAHKANNQRVAELLTEHGVTEEDMLICDSSENKSVADLVEYGFYARGAEKGPGSVNYSMKWLQGLVEIVIDPVRCPETAEEFLTYEHEKSKDGEIITGYPDKNNHRIDATRYALNLVWRQRGN